MNTHIGSFRHFYPLSRLNAGVSKLDIFNRDKSKPLELGFRLKRFEACVKSFHHYTIRLHRLLDSISGHFDVTYNSKERKEPYQYKLVEKFIYLENDLFLFFTIIKILLDDMAFFVPFYFREALQYNKNIPDLRDTERPPPFNGLKHFFFKYEAIDKGFVGILKANEEWTNEICKIRNFLIHRFHDLTIHNDWWTHAYYAILYEFYEQRYFIPNVLTFIAKTYFKFVRFTEMYEEHFKCVCKEQFPEYEYFEDGHAVSSGLDKTHLFYSGLGKLLEDEILIRVHPARRKHIPIILEFFMRDENIFCNSCDWYIINIKPTIEHFVRISSCCNCGKLLPIPLRVESKVYPHFMNQNEDIVKYLVPYELKNEILKFRKDWFIRHEDNATNDEGE